MKKMRSLSAILAAALALTAFAGCGATDNSSTTDNASDNTSAADNAETVASDEAVSENSYKIGVIQYGSHPSLDNCFSGIEQALTESDLELTIDRQDGNFDSATCDTIAKNMAAKQYDMIFAIATPAAVSAFAATANTDIPVIFCAVSDPVAAGLVEDMNAPGGNCTGTSDILDFSAQLDLIQALQPEVKKIGVLYTTSEANSVSQLASLREAADPRGIEIVDQGVQGAADVPQAAASLVTKVDCVNNFTDNNVVSNLTVLLEQANSANIPVYGSEIEQVINGCMASVSIDYVALGRATVDMGIRVLGGESAGTIPVGKISDGTAVVNTEVMDKFGITLPDSYADAEKVTSADKEDAE